MRVVKIVSERSEWLYEYRYSFLTGCRSCVNGSIDHRGVKGVDVKLFQNQWVTASHLNVTEITVFTCCYKLFIH